MAADETQLAIQWIVATLRAASAVTTLVGQRIFEMGSVPGNTTFPLILANFQAAAIPREVGQRNLYSDGYYVVRGVMGGGAAMTALGPIASAIRGALDEKKNVAVTGGTILTSTRVEHFRLAEPPDPGGTVYRHLGGLYRIEVQAT